MLETILTVAGSIAGILATTAIPIIVAWIANREKKRRAAEASGDRPSFGIALSPDAERADRMTTQLIESLTAARDRAEARADAAEARELTLITERTRLLAEIDRMHEKEAP